MVEGQVVPCQVTKVTQRIITYQCTDSLSTPSLYDTSPFNDHSLNSLAKYRQGFYMRHNDTMPIHRVNCEIMTIQMLHLHKESGGNACLFAAF